jgi:hypothetical protein
MDDGSGGGAEVLILTSANLASISVQRPQSREKMPKEGVSLPIE